MLNSLYAGLWYLLTPLLPFYLAWRWGCGKEEAGRIRERFGYPRHNIAQAKTLWIHAASVGEVNSIIPLMAHLQKRLKGDKNDTDDIAILLTTSSRHGQTVAINLTFPNLYVQYLPLDHPRWGRRFVRHYRPYAALWVEQELWPNILFSAHAHAVCLALINGRLTEKSARRWRFGMNLARQLACLFDLVLAQSPQDQRNFENLNFAAHYRGNLKAAQPLQTADKLSTIIEILPRTRQTWLAASSHKGESEICLHAHLRLQKHFASSLLVLAPRYPRTAIKLAALSAKLGLTAKLYSRLDKSHAELSDDIDVLIIDQFGLLPSLYQSIPMAFLGGSAGQKVIGRNCGGHNPLEAIQHGCCLISGGDMRNFSRANESLQAAKAIISIDVTADNLASALTDLRTHHDAAQNMRQRAQQIWHELSDEAQQALDDITHWLARLA